MREPHEMLMFLPGASGNTQFWAPAAKLLRHPGARRFQAWPGFGGVPSEPGVRGIADLVSRMVGQIEGPTALIAQSMGASSRFEQRSRSPTWYGISCSP